MGTEVLNFQSLQLICTINIIKKTNAFGYISLILQVYIVQS